MGFRLSHIKGKSWAHGATSNWEISWRAYQGRFFKTKFTQNSDNFTSTDISFILNVVSAPYTKKNWSAYSFSNIFPLTVKIYLARICTQDDCDFILLKSLDNFWSLKLCKTFGVNWAKNIFYWKNFTVWEKWSDWFEKCPLSWTDILVKVAHFFACGKADFPIRTWWWNNPGAHDQLVPL